MTDYDPPADITTTDYESPTEALAAAVEYLGRDGGRKVPDHQLSEAQFGQRSATCGGRFYFVLRYTVEAENGRTYVVRQTTADQLRKVIEAWDEVFKAEKRQMEDERS